jgi:hypothetical protein
MDGVIDRERLTELFPVFTEMPAPTLERILREAQLRRVASGTPKFSAGNPCSGFPLLLEGTVREIVGRVLRNFEDRGLVELSRSQITVLDRAGLEALAATDA